MEHQKKQTWENTYGRSIATMLTRLRMVEGLSVERIAEAAELPIEKYLLFEDLLGGLTVAEVSRVEKVIYNYAESRLRALKSRRKYLMGWKGMVLHHIKFRWYQFWFSDSQIGCFAIFFLFADFFMILLASTVIKIPLVDNLMGAFGRSVKFIVLNQEWILPPVIMFLVFFGRKVYYRICEANDE